MTVDEIVAELRTHANADNVAGMARYGISSSGTLGVNIPTIRAINPKSEKWCATRW